MKAFRFKNLSEFKNINHGISTRDFGSMKNVDGSINRDNMKSFLIGQDINLEAVCMEQVHGGNVAIITEADKLMVEGVDGLITNQKNIPLCVVTADCLPIIFYDVDKKVIGVAHGGRIGLQSGIIENMIEKFKNDFNSNTQNIVVGVGPGIENKCYELDGKFMDIRHWANFILLAEGILQKNIENLDICTKCNMDKFFSYRGGDTANRFVTAISII